MDFDYSEDQKFLKSEIRKFLEAHCTAAVVRTVLDDPSLQQSAELWRDIAAQGWLGAAIPEQYGGQGLGIVDLCAIAEEMGRALAPVPFSSTLYLLTQALLQAGSDDQKAKWLPRIARGETIGCLALGETLGPVLGGPVRAQVTKGVLTGEKHAVTDGGIAHLALVLASEDNVSTLYLVDLSGDGVSRFSQNALDPTRGVARLVFDKAAAEPLGQGGEGRFLAQTLLDRAAVLFAFEQIGGADRALEMAIAYAKERFAFGRPIGSYQAIKHKLADMFVKNALARSHAYFAACALDTDADFLPRAASAARVSAGDAFWYAAKENLQTHGGIGFTWDVDCHLFYRRALSLGLVIGSSAFWKERLVQQLEQAAA